MRARRIERAGESRVEGRERALNCISRCLHLLFIDADIGVVLEGEPYGVVERQREFAVHHMLHESAGLSRNLLPVRKFLELKSLRMMRRDLAAGCRSKCEDKNKTDQACARE